MWHHLVKVQRRTQDDTVSRSYLCAHRSGDVPGGSRSAVPDNKTAHVSVRAGCRGLYAYRGACADPDVDGQSCAQPPGPPEENLVLAQVHSVAPFM